MKHRVSGCGWVWEESVRDSAADGSETSEAGWLWLWRPQSDDRATQRKIDEAVEVRSSKFESHCRDAVTP